jgi:hypothetical protein
VHFLDTKSRAPDLFDYGAEGPSDRGCVVLAAVASALLNRWLAHKASVVTLRSGDSSRCTVFASTTLSGGQSPLWSCCTATGVSSKTSNPGG